MPSPSLPAETETAPFQVSVDEDLPELDAPGAGSVAWVVLAAGIAVTLLALKVGWDAFFLPIILPFGLGGGSFLRRALRRLRPRVLHLHGGTLSLVTVGPLGAVRRGAVEVSSGLFVSLESTGTWVNGNEEVDLRVVSGSGALVVPLASSEQARIVRRRLETLLDEAGVPLVEPDEPLQGAVSVREVEGGSEIAWMSARRSVGSKLVPFFVLPAFFLFVVLATGFAKVVLAELLPLVLVVGLGVLFFSGLGLPGGTRRTALRFVEDAWGLRVLSGARVVASTGGPGPLLARVVRQEGFDPGGSRLGVAGRALELVSDGEIVGRVGEDLSEPELRFVAERVSAESR